jgi:hypothetical protein
MHLLAKDVDAWWELIQAKQISRKYGEHKLAVGHFVSAARITDFRFIDALRPSVDTSTVNSA